MALAIQILRTANSLESAARRAFKDLGLTPAQFNVLNIVADFPAGVPLFVVADELLVDRSNITGLVKHLVGDGLLGLADSPTDGRQKLAHLTPKGRRLWQKANAVYLAGLEQVAQAVGKKHLAALLASLKQVEESADDLYR